MSNSSDDEYLHSVSDTTHTVNSTYHHHCPDGFYERYLYITMASLGLILNIVSICTIICGQKMNKEVKLQMTNLAIADLLACLVPGYLQVPWAFNTDVSCKMLSFVGYGSFHTGPLWNMVISMERLVIVYFPFRARRYSSRYKIIVAVCVWTAGLALETPLVFYITAGNKQSTGRKEYECQAHLGSNNLVFWINVFGFGVPVLIIVTSYLLICWKLCQTVHIGESVGCRQAQDTSKRNQVRPYTCVPYFLSKLSKISAAKK